MAGDDEPDTVSRTTVLKPLRCVSFDSKDNMAGDDKPDIDSRTTVLKPLRFVSFDS